MVEVRLAQDREDGEAQTVDMEVTFNTGTNPTQPWYRSESRLLGPERRSQHHDVCVQMLEQDSLCYVFKIKVYSLCSMCKCTRHTVR
jgi:hypothetical protein